MSTKERLLSIHLRNKLVLHPDYARTLGIEVLPLLSCSDKMTQNSGNTTFSEPTHI